MFIFSQFHILAAKNKHCDEINSAIVNLKMLSGQVKTLLSLKTMTIFCFLQNFQMVYPFNSGLALPPSQFDIKATTFK